MYQPTIFLIEENHDTRPAIRETLKNHGYKVSLAIDEEDAIERVENDLSKADLVILNLCDKTPEAILEIGRNICRIGNLNIPKVVIAEEYNEDLEGQNVKVSETEYITYLEDSGQLFKLLSKLIPRES